MVRRQMNRNRHLRGRGAIEIIEEAVHLLRLSPASLLATYYIGSLPFILGLLLFWTDMSRSAFAGKHCGAASFGLAMLFVWMKCWQAVFALQLRANISGEQAPHWTLGRIARLAVAQTVIQPSRFFVLPFAMLMALPFGWIYAFYQNVSAQGEGESYGVRVIVKRSWQQARLWPRQNHILLAMFFIFGVFIFINLAMSIFLLPRLLKILLGIETVFTKSGWSMLNTTFFATTCGITYLCMDPLVKSVYVLRCFYGSSVHTGEDLKAELKRFLPLKKILAIPMIFLLGSTALSAPMAHENTQTLFFKYQMSRHRVSPVELDRSIEEVMNRREYTWRMPREKTSRDNRDKTGPIAGFIRWIAETLRNIGRTIMRWIEKLGVWLEKLLPRTEGGREPSDTGWMTSVRTFVVVLVGLLVCVLAIVLWRTWRRRWKHQVRVVGEAISSRPHLTDDRVGADELPADRWLVLARELIEKGELQLALRALYLASLAHLADHELITIARHKSNRDYQLDLQRRAHDRLDLVAVFSKNVAIFERAWYGMHEVTHEEMKHFTTNQERIEACVER